LFCKDLGVTNVKFSEFQAFDAEGFAEIPKKLPTL